MMVQPRSIRSRRAFCAAPAEYCGAPSPHVVPSESAAPQTVRVRAPSSVICGAHPRSRPLYQPTEAGIARPGLFRNMFVKLVTLAMFQSAKLRVASMALPSNIPAIPTTFAVFQFDKLWLNAVAPENIPVMSSTPTVFQSPIA